MATTQTPQNQNPPMPDRLARFVALEKTRRDLDERLKRVKQEASKLAEQILEEWADRGQRQAKVDGLTVYVAIDFYCNKRSGLSTDKVCTVLETVGLSNLVAPNYSASSLKSWVKEQLAESGEIPDELQAVLTYDELPRLKTRRS